VLAEWKAQLTDSTADKRRYLRQTIIQLSQQSEMNENLLFNMSYLICKLGLLVRGQLLNELESS